MFIGGTIVLLGSAIVTAAQNRAMFLGGRFTLGFGIAISTTAAPTWVTELAPAHWRGRLGAMYNSEYRTVAQLAMMCFSLTMLFKVAFSLDQSLLPV